MLLRVHVAGNIPTGRRTRWENNHATVRFGAFDQVEHQLSDAVSIEQREDQQDHALRSVGIRRGRRQGLFAMLDDVQSAVARGRADKRGERQFAGRHFLAFPTAVGRLFGHHESEGSPRERFKELRLPNDGRHNRDKVQSENIRAVRAGDEARLGGKHNRMRHERGIRSAVGLRGEGDEEGRKLDGSGGHDAGAVRLYTVQRRREQIERQEEEGNREAG